MPKKLPKSFEKYFWDVDFSKVDIQKHKILIIKRFLDRGKTKDVKLLLSIYSFDDIKAVIRLTKDISRPTGTFWSKLLSISPKEVPCLQKPYFPIHFGLSS